MSLPDHPPAIWVREEALLENIVELFATRVFETERRTLLASQLQRAVKEQSESARNQDQRLRRAVQKLEEREARLVRSLELDDDPEGLLFRRVRDRLQELLREREGKLAAIEKLRPADEQEPRQTPELVDRLPILERRINRLSQAALRRLFEVFQLKIAYDRTVHSARVQVTLRANSADELTPIVTHAVLSRYPCPIT